MPFVATARTATTQFIGRGLPTREAPLPYGFIGHGAPTLCEKLFDISVTEREAEIQPDRVTANFRWEAKAFVDGSSGVCFHAMSMSEISLFGKLTIPSLQGQAAA